MKRRLFNLLAAVSLLLCAAVCVLWVRSRAGYDQVLWAYDRWLPDGRAASNQVELMSDTRLWLTIVSGRVGPPNGQQVWGYYINADQSRGHPRLTLHHERYDPAALALGAYHDDVLGRPLSWARSTRTAQRNGDDNVTLRFGISHWLAFALLAILPAWAAWRTIGPWRRRRKREHHGRCQPCGYDLRATPDRCPECGARVTRRKSGQV